MRTIIAESLTGPRAGDDLERFLAPARGVVAVDRVAGKFVRQIAASNTEIEPPAG